MLVLTTQVIYWLQSLRTPMEIETQVVWTHTHAYTHTSFTVEHAKWIRSQEPFKDNWLASLNTVILQIRSRIPDIAITLSGGTWSCKGQWRLCECKWDLIQLTSLQSLSSCNKMETTFGKFLCFNRGLPACFSKHRLNYKGRHR